MRWRPTRPSPLPPGPAAWWSLGSRGRSAWYEQGPPLIIHSSDGLTWDRLDLSSVFDNAYFRDVTAYAGGFVDRWARWRGGCSGGPPAVGVPAAWTSADGVTWLAAEVEGSEAPGATLSSVIAGADGLFATGRQTDTTQMSGQASAQRLGLNRRTVVAAGERELGTDRLAWRSRATAG